MITYKILNNGLLPLYLVFWVSAILCWWQFLQNTTAFFTWKEYSMAAPSFPGTVVYLEAAWAHDRWQHSWEFVSSFQGFCSEQAQGLNISPETSFMRGHQNHHPFPSESFPLCPRSMRWKTNAAALVHTTLAEVSLPSPAFRDLVPSLSFLAVHNSCFFKLSSRTWFYQMFF